MALATAWRQKRPSSLTNTQRQLKLQKDSEYEMAVQNLSIPFYQKKRSVGVTAQEEAGYEQQKAELWGEYQKWARENGFYELVTPEQQLAEAEEALTIQLDEVNQIRTGLGKIPLEIKEG